MKCRHHSVLYCSHVTNCSLLPIGIDISGALISGGEKRNDSTLRIFQKLLKLWFLYLIPIMTKTFNTCVENFSFVGKKTKERHHFQNALSKMITIPLTYSG